MTKDTIYIMLTILKAIIIIVGMAFMILNFLLWLTTKDKQKLKKVAFIFAGIALSLLILTGIEFIIAFN